MILVDTSIWIDHIRSSNPELQGLLEQKQILSHPFVIGELAVGNLKDRDVILSSLQELPEAIVTQNHEVLHFLSRHALYGVGIGYIDAHLLASARLSAGTSLWTRDQRLHQVATKLSLAWASDPPNWLTLN